MFFKNRSAASRLSKTVIFELAKGRSRFPTEDSPTNETEPMRGEKGSASPPRKEIGGYAHSFENAQYPVDTADMALSHL